MNSSTFTELFGFPRMIVTKVEKDKRKMSLDIESNLGTSLKRAFWEKLMTII